MTEAASETIPPWTLGWRLQRALDWAGISVQQMAGELAVSRQTVSGWMNDRHAPRVIYLRAWAARCRVPYEWLVSGDEGGLPRVDSNHQPAGPRTSDQKLTRQEILAFRKTIRPGRRASATAASDTS